MKIEFKNVEDSYVFEVGAQISTGCFITKVDRINGSIEIDITQAEKDREEILKTMKEL